MPKIIYWDIEHNQRISIEPKIDAPEQYAEKQQQLRQYFEAGKRYRLQRIYRKSCPTCGDTFYTTTKIQIYDTDSCKDKARRNRCKVTQICYCETCKQPFTPRRKDANYCSNKCRQQAYRYRNNPR